MRQIIAFNWPKLVAGMGVAVGAGSAALGMTGAAWPVRLVLLAAAVGSAYLLIASLAVSWWIYDRSDLHEWSWLRPALPLAAPRWVLLHAGLDESGPGLHAVFGGRPAAVIDISSRLSQTSPSLRRAQRATAGTALLSDCPKLALRTAALDAVVMVFAAHEVRDVAQRGGLFDELRRSLAPGGRLILVEHLRDAANIAAFGPAAWHFQTRRTWLDVAGRAGFGVTAEIHQTPFVRGIVLCRA